MKPFITWIAAVFLLLPAAADAQVTFQASRTSGVAPLAVFFDALDTSVNGVSQPFHDLDFEWCFNDPAAGQWVPEMPDSGRRDSRNRDKGAVSAHVFTAPGTYTVTLFVRGHSGLIGQHQAAITVHDPDLIYSGTDTVCICDTTTNDFTGCPPGAAQVATDNILDIQNHISTGRRILLHRGSSWTTSGYVHHSNIQGPVTIGAYGPCISPDDRGICQNAPVIHLAGSAQAGLFSMYNIDDWRIQDLHITGDTVRQGALTGATDIFRLLLFRLWVEGFQVPLGASHWDTDGHDQIMLISSDVSGGDLNQVYIGSRRLVIMGNDLRDSNESHVLRVWQAFKGVISHNVLSGSSLQSQSGRHAVKLHGPSQEVLANAGNGEGGLADPTRYVVVRDNIFGGSGPWPVAIGPQSSVADERLSDLLIEKNYFIPAYGSQSCCSSPVQVALYISADQVTVRNNVFDGVGSSQYYTAVNLLRRGIEPMHTGIQLYNNTIHKSDLLSGYTSCTGFSVSDTVSGTIIRNNLAHFPQNTTSVTLISNSSADLVADHNLLTNTPGLADPDHMNLLMRDFRLLPSSVARNTGTGVPVFDDRAEKRRPLLNEYDLGAYEFSPTGLQGLHLLLE